MACSEEACGNCQGCPAEDKEPTLSEFLIQELTQHISVCRSKAAVYEALVKDVPNLSEESKNAILHLLMKSRKDL
jgi:hypothetical protein